MTALRSYDPFAVEPVEDAFRQWLRPWRGDAPSAPQIRIEVREAEGEYRVKAQIPGVRKDDIDVRIDGDTVSISAEIREEKAEKKDGKVLRSEFSYGQASRTFSLATPVDAGKADAHYEAGVLDLVLPKRASAESRKLAIH